jgi:CDP-diacylglycerol--glycerol-3-phosphate 3-phosphatidyltransferase
VIKSVLGKDLDPLIQRIFPFLFRRELDPNLLSACGALVSIAAAAAFGVGRLGLGGLLILLGGFFDLVDGVVARHQGISTRFGAFLDSTLDRLSDMALLLGLGVHYGVRGEPWHALLAGAALASSVLVSYTKARAEVDIGSLEVGILERAERVVILAAGALFGFVIPALWIITLGSTITVIQRVSVAHREMERLDEADRSGLGEQTG